MDPRFHSDEAEKLERFTYKMNLLENEEIHT